MYTTESENKIRVATPIRVASECCVEVRVADCVEAHMSHIFLGLGMFDQILNVVIILPSGCVLRIRSILYVCDMNVK